MAHTAMESFGAATGSLRTYAIGFLLSAVLTVLAFALVMSGALPRWAALSSIVVAAVAQIMVHLHTFLHLGASSSSRWNVLALLLTVLIIVMFVGGTLWIMANLNYRMM